MNKKYNNIIATILFLFVISLHPGLGYADGSKDNIFLHEESLLNSAMEFTEIKIVKKFAGSSIIYLSPNNVIQVYFPIPKHGEYKDLDRNRLDMIDTAGKFHPGEIDPSRTYCSSIAYDGMFSCYAGSKFNQNPREFRKIRVTRMDYDEDDPLKNVTEIEMPKIEFLLESSGDDGKDTLVIKRTDLKKTAKLGAVTTKDGEQIYKPSKGKNDIPKEGYKVKLDKSSCDVDEKGGYTLVVTIKTYDEDKKEEAREKYEISLGYQCSSSFGKWQAGKSIYEKLKNARKKFNDVLAKFNKDKNEYDQIKAELDLKEKELETAKNNYDAAKTTLDAKTKELEGRERLLNEELKAAEERLDVLKEERDSAEKEAESKKSSKEEVNDQINNYKAEVKRLHGEITALTDEKIEADTWMKEHEGDVTKAKNEFNAKQKEFDRLINDAGILKEYNEKQTDLDNAKEELERIAREIEDEKKAVYEQEYQKGLDNPTDCSGNDADWDF